MTSELGWHIVLLVNLFPSQKACVPRAPVVCRTKWILRTRNVVMTCLVSCMMEMPLGPCCDTEIHIVLCKARFR